MMNRFGDRPKLLRNMTNEEFMKVLCLLLDGSMNTMVSDCGSTVHHSDCEYCE